MRLDLSSRMNYGHNIIDVLSLHDYRCFNSKNIIFHFSKEKPNRFRSFDFVQTGRNTEYRIISVDIVLDLTVM